jgi:hypothetical protein
MERALQSEVTDRRTAAFCAICERAARSQLRFSARSEPGQFPRSLKRVARNCLWYAWPRCLLTCIRIVKPASFLKELVEQNKTLSRTKAPLSSPVSLRFEFTRSVSMRMYEIHGRYDRLPVCHVVFWHRGKARPRRRFLVGLSCTVCALYGARSRSATQTNRNLPSCAVVGTSLFKRDSTRQRGVAVLSHPQHYRSFYCTIIRLASNVNPVALLDTTDGSEGGLEPELTG